MSVTRVVVVPLAWRFGWLCRRRLGPRFAGRVKQGAISTGTVFGFAVGTIARFAVGEVAVGVVVVLELVPMGYFIV